jgi:glycosyltransferase involved in cell wall biosynthesis
MIPLVRGLRRYFSVRTLLWRPMAVFTKGSSLLVVPSLISSILLRSLMTEPDLILAQYAFPDGFSSVVASTLLRIPCVIQVVGSDILLAARGFRRRLIEWAVHKASGVICVSRQLEDYVRGMGAFNTTVIPSPLDPSDFKPMKVQRAENRLITVAMLTEVKGLDILLRALHSVSGVELLIVGDGPERANLERLAETLGLTGRVKFLGLVRHDEVWGYMLSSSVFVLPSLSEGLPRALLEAMACGLFIIASDVGGIRDVVRDGWNGILVNPADPQALRTAILRAMANREWIKVVSERNKLEAQAFHLGKVAEKQFRFLVSLISDRAGE